MEGAPNLDGMDRDDLVAFSVEHAGGRGWRRMFHGTPRARRATEDLALYAGNKAAAMLAREMGDVSTARMYEDFCDRIYSRLPSFAQW